MSLSASACDFSAPTFLYREAIFCKEKRHTRTGRPHQRKNADYGGVEASLQQQRTPGRDKSEGHKDKWDRATLEALVHGRFHLSKHRDDEVWAHLCSALPSPWVFLCACSSSTYVWHMRSGLTRC